MTDGPALDLRYADPPPPGDLAARAIRRGRVLRRRRRAVSGAGALLAVTAIAWTAGGLLGQDRAVPPAGSVQVSLGGPAPCAPTDLSVTLGRSDGTAGTTYLEIVFTGTGTSPCLLRGYPGVSFLDQAGAPLGLPAQRTAGPTAGTTVTLAPGATAFSALAIPDVTVYGPIGSPPCSAAPAAAIRVFAPGSRTPVSLPASTTVCTATTGITRVSPVAAGRM